MRAVPSSNIVVSYDPTPVQEELPATSTEEEQPLLGADVEQTDGLDAEEIAPND